MKTLPVDMMKQAKEADSKQSSALIKLQGARKRAAKRPPPPPLPSKTEKPKPR